jgi:DNA-binding beta-propeller fold protein YncE
VARVRAPELTGSGGWIGASADFGLASLAGKVVVLHFFTPSCINCVRVLGELKPIEQRFSAEAVVIGVHSPKFPHEHEHAVVERAVERLGIRHAVLDDPDLSTWRQYGIKGWPTVVVIDPEGYVVGAVSGEGTGDVIFGAVERTVSEHQDKGTAVRGAVAGMWGTMPISTGIRTVSYPGKVAVDHSGRRIAVADTGKGRVIVMDRRGRVEHVFPLLTQPQGVCFDGDRVLVCDTGTDRVLSIDRATGTQDVVAAEIASPWDVAVLADGSALIAEAGRHRLWRAPPATPGEPRGEATIVAGTGQENLVDGPSPLLAQPSGVAALPGGGAVFVDAESSSLRVLTPEGTVVTLVGQGLFDWGASDGGPDAAAMQHPLGVAVGPVGDGGLPEVYVADSYNGTIRVWSGSAWSADAGKLRTLPGSGLDEPGGLAVLPDGHLIVADTNNHRVVVITPDSPEPEVLAIDESWLGTDTGDPIAVAAGSTMSVPFELDPGSLSLDHSDGPPVVVEVSADPGTLLAAGSRRWALDSATGSVALTAGAAGEGIIVVELTVSSCDDDQSTVLHGRSRHDLTVTSGGDAPAPEAP